MGYLCKSERTTSVKVAPMNLDNAINERVLGTDKDGDRTDSSVGMCTRLD